MKIGDKINGLTMIGEPFTKEDKKRWALFLCECGNKKEIRIDRVKSGRAQYCGCHSGMGGKGNLKYGICYTRLYHAWESMKRRCTNKNSKDYKNYGGRGITICDEWKDPKAFYDWAMTNGYKENLTIDRIDNNGNYEPSNCRWVTNKVQANNKRNSRLITYEGKTQTLAQWCEDLKIPYKKIHTRLRRGWDVKRAFNS